MHSLEHVHFTMFSIMMCLLTETMYLVWCDAPAVLFAACPTRTHPPAVYRWCPSLVLTLLSFPGRAASRGRYSGRSCKQWEKANEMCIEEEDEIVKRYVKAERNCCKRMFGSSEHDAMTFLVRSSTRAVRRSSLPMLPVLLTERPRA